MPDELMYSWIARLAVANGCDGTEASALRLFSRLYVHPASPTGITEPHYDCHDDMSLFMLSTGLSKESLNELYLRHNIFPAIAPFMHKMRQVNFVNRALYPNNIGFNTLIFKYSNGYIPTTKICPDCAKEDMDAHGFFYLHTSHHLPSVCYCHKHKTHLRTFTGVSSYELKDFNKYSYIEDDIEIPDAKYKYAKDYHDFMQMDLGCETADITSALSKKIKELGYTKIKSKEVLKELRSRNPVIKDKRRINSLLTTISSPRGSSLDFETAMSIISVLFKDIEEFSQYLEINSSVKDDFFEAILENNYRLIGKYNELIVLLQDISTNKLFFTSPYGFLVGWRNPDDIAGLSESEMFESMVENIEHGDYSVVSKFTSTDEKITIRHNICGREMQITPSGFLLSNGRCICEKNVTYEKAVRKLKTIAGDSFELMDYTKQSDDATFKCNCCGNIITKPFHLMSRFPFCEVCKERENQARNIEKARLLNEQRTRRKDKVANGIIQLSEPKLIDTKDGKFQKVDSRHDVEYFEKQIEALVGDEYELVGTFNSIHDKTQIKHNKCGLIFETTPAAFISGRRCDCCSNIPDSEFFEYVEKASYGRYSINAHKNPVNTRYEVIDNETKAIKKIAKRKILQELSRITPSAILPCDRPQVLSPYTMSDSYKLYSWLMKNFGEKDIFTQSEIHLTEENWDLDKINRTIITLMKANKIYSKGLGFYCLSDYNHSPEEIAFYSFCTRNGKRIGYLRNVTLRDSLLHQEISGDLWVRSNLGSSKKTHITHIGDYNIRDNITPIECTDENVDILQILEIVSTPRNIFELIYPQIEKEALSKGITYEKCLNFANALDKKLRYVDPNLKKLFKYGKTGKHFTPPVSWDETYEQLKSIYGTERPIIPELIPLDMTYSQRTGAVQNLEKLGKVKRLAKGIYVLSESSMTLEEALDNKYLYDAYGNHIGYPSYQNFEYILGMRKDKPSENFFVSNLRIDVNNSKSLRLKRGNSYINIRRPRCEITNDNYKILPMLDMLIKFPNNVDDPMRYLKAYVEKERITYKMCLPYIEAYRGCVSNRLKELFNIQ